MPTPVETVTAFLSDCSKSKSAMYETVRAYFTPTTVWENVGLVTTTGIDGAVAFMEAGETGSGVARFTVETLAIAAQGDKVLTERVDRLLDADDRTLKTLRLMGVFEVEGGRIAAWRDYYDMSDFRGTGV